MDKRKDDDEEEGVNLSVMDVMPILSLWMSG